VAITFPHIFKDGERMVASGAQVMDNLNALKGPVDANTSAVEALQAVLKVGGTSIVGEIQHVESSAEMGATSFGGYSETGISFPVACLLVMVVGIQFFTSGTHEASAAITAAGTVNVRAEPETKHAKVVFQNGTGATRYAVMQLVAVGH
jgi:hypothetical protein